MRRLFAQLIAFALTAFTIGVAYRYFWDQARPVSRTICVVACTGWD
jgi:hypothetical protein